METGTRPNLTSPRYADMTSMKQTIERTGLFHSCGMMFMSARGQRASAREASGGCVWRAGGLCVCGERVASGWCVVCVVCVASALSRAGGCVCVASARLDASGCVCVCVCVCVCGEGLFGRGPWDAGPRMRALGRGLQAGAAKSRAVGARRGPSQR
eukprot:7078185-Prymnesium_polylepis.2